MEEASTIIPIPTPLGCLSGIWEGDEFVAMGKLTYRGKTYTVRVVLYWRDGDVALVKPGPQPGTIFDCKWNIMTPTWCRAEGKTRADIGDAMRRPIFNAMRTSALDV